MDANHPYNNNSEAYNFFFHPFHNRNSQEIALPIITNIFLSIFTVGAWAYCINC